MHHNSVSKNIRSFCGYILRLGVYKYYIQNIVLNKTIFPLAMSVLVLIPILSCKHQLPELDNPPGGSNPPATSTCSPDSVYFQQQVLPIFVSNCAMPGCHDNISHEGGLVLTTYSGIVAGGVRGGNPGNSKIYKVIITTDAGDRMPPPPRNPLPKEQVDLIYKWIVQGATNNSCVNSVCDTASVTYSVSIKPIITTKCQGCHSSSSPGGGIDLSTYNGIKTIVNNGKLWGSVNFITGFSPMPKNGTRLSTCELAKIKKWIDAGSPNN